MNKRQFDQLAAEGYTLIPLAREVLADLDTPLSTYLRLACSVPYTYLFESVHGGEKWGRYSIIGLPSKEVIKVSGTRIVVEVDGRVRNEILAEDPLAWIGEYQGRYLVPTLGHLPRFTGGAGGLLRV